MTIEDVKEKMLDLTRAIKEYKGGKDYNSVELEMLVDDMLCRLPRDVFYIEWYDRSQVESLVDSRIKYLNEIGQKTEKTTGLINECMYDLCVNDSFINDDDIKYSIDDTIDRYKGK